MKCLENKCTEETPALSSSLKRKIERHHSKYTDETGLNPFIKCSLACKLRRYYLGDTTEKREELQQANKILEGK